MHPRPVNRHAALAALVFASALIHVLTPTAAADPWSGSVTAKLDMDLANYSRHETQTWTLTGGAPIMQGTAALYPATWHYTGTGSSTIYPPAAPSQHITWTIEATLNVQIEISVRPSDNQLVFHQVSLADALGALTVAPPGSGRYALNEWSFGSIEADPAKVYP